MPCPIFLAPVVVSLYCYISLEYIRFRFLAVIVLLLHEIYYYLKHFKNCNFIVCRFRPNQIESVKVQDQSSDKLFRMRRKMRDHLVERRWLAPWSYIEGQWPRNLKGGIGESLFDPFINSVGQRPYWPWFLCTFGYGAIIRRDLRKLLLPSDSPCDNLYACVM